MSWLTAFHSLLCLFSYRFHMGIKHYEVVLLELFSGFMYTQWIIFCQIGTENQMTENIHHLINNPRMFNGAIVDLAEKPYIPQNFLLQWICCKCLAGCYRHSYFWPPWRLLEATHHTATAHFGTEGWTEHWVKVPKCALAVWCLASNSLNGGQK